MHWVFSPEWDASKGGSSDPKGILVFPHGEHERDGQDRHDQDRGVI